MSQAKEKRLERPVGGFSETNTSIDSTELSNNQYEKQRLMHESRDMPVTDKPILLQNLRKCQPKYYLLVHILIMIFGTSAWIGVNGIFIQLPLLVNTAPESWKLATYLVIAVQAANIAPIIYSLFRKSSCKSNEFCCILSSLGFASVVMGLLAFFYDKTSNISGQDHSIVLILLTFFTATVSCTSSVLFMPYLRNFKECYLFSYFIGEGLSGVMPSVIALIQGINETSICNNSTNSLQVTVASLARFSPQDYFLFLFSCLILSTIAFALLENLSFIKTEKMSFEISDHNSSNGETENCHCRKQVSVLSKSSMADNDISEKYICVDNYKTTDERSSTVFYTKNINGIILTDSYLYALLSMICLFANGFLPSLQPYSCLSYGNMTYHLSATFSQISNPSVCLLAMWFVTYSRKIINWLSFFIFILSSYVMYLAISSPNPPLKNSDFGKALVIMLWILLVGLISYVKLIITSVFRKKSEKTLFQVGVAMQVGSACGAVLSFVIINYTGWLREYKSCSSS
ncbi:solute carrier family 52, riboflavin transporter, member 3-A-like [Phymastichus coffea]|uniref:solute carrier family 52, riboflavin transporter, member 3-A-like n=1 Tax=Phymastichus coffea TaxID=108790 RepID=UPI00273C6697|nr:solute carrier family 52, riboflavin transporter, member 3-A-like [Phymastichus coffea]